MNHLLFAKKIIFTYLVFYDSLINAYKHPDYHCTTKFHDHMCSGLSSMRMAKVLIVESLSSGSVQADVTVQGINSGAAEKQCCSYISRMIHYPTMSALTFRI